MIVIVNLEFLKRNKIALAGLGLVLIFFLGGYIYVQNKNGNPVLPGQKPNVLVQDQNLIEKVGKLILLPTGETPQIATVSDKTKLSGQNFFANAENGDKVLIYYQAKKAILYRPSINKIVEVGPIEIPQQTREVSPTPVHISTPSAKPTLEVPPPIR